MTDPLGPEWRWWRRGAEEISLRHAVRVLLQGATLEEIVLRGGPPIDRALQSHQRGKRAMGRNDRLLLGTAVYALARNRELYRTALDDAPTGAGHHLLLALIDSQTPASELGKIPHLPGGITPWLRALERVRALRAGWVTMLRRSWTEPPGHLSTDAAKALEGLFSIPRWWLEAGPWSSLGEAVAELSVLKNPQRLTLRVQAARAERTDVLGRLSELGVPSGPTSRSPWGVRVEGRHNVLATDLFREGTVEVQDEGSQLVACLCDPRPGEKVLDLCAGAGGKTLALASAMGARGRVVAHDTDARRLGDARKRARRAALGNVQVTGDLGDVRAQGPYDLVLADVPCTSSGTLRRNPDVAWRWNRLDLERLTRLQREILTEAATLVRPGGHLVYATCSVLDAENAAQAHWFLENQPAFVPAPPGERRQHAAFRGVPGAETGAFRLAANLSDYQGDAFFLARFRLRG